MCYTCIYVLHLSVHLLHDLKPLHDPCVTSNVSVNSDLPQMLITRPISVFCAPPTAVRLLQVQKDFDKVRGSSLRHCVAGGEPVVSWK